MPIGHGHTAESLMRECETRWLSLGNLYEELPHDCDTYREYEAWVELYHDLKALKEVAA